MTLKYILISVEILRKNGGAQTRNECIRNVLDEQMVPKKNKLLRMNAERFVKVSGVKSPRQSRNSSLIADVRDALSLGLF